MRTNGKLSISPAQRVEQFRVETAHPGDDGRTRVAIQPRHIWKARGRRVGDRHNVNAHRTAGVSDRHEVPCRFDPTVMPPHISYDANVESLQKRS